FESPPRFGPPTSWVRSTMALVVARQISLAVARNVLWASGGVVLSGPGSWTSGSPPHPASTARRAPARAAPATRRPRERLRSVASGRPCIDGTVPVWGKQHESAIQGCAHPSPESLCVVQVRHCEHSHIVLLIVVSSVGAVRCVFTILCRPVVHLELFEGTFQWRSAKRCMRT